MKKIILAISVVVAITIIWWVNLSKTKEITPDLNITKQIEPIQPVEEKNIMPPVETLGENYSAKDDLEYNVSDSASEQISSPVVQEISESDYMADEVDMSDEIYAEEVDMFDGEDSKEIDMTESMNMEEVSPY